MLALCAEADQVATGKDSTILVILQMAGGNDGLNTVVPHGNDFYYKARTRIAIPAPFYLLFWFAMQFLNGYESIGDRSYTGGGVAWFAHIGGFIAGMLLIKLFPSRQRWRHWYDES